MKYKRMMIPEELRYMTMIDPPRSATKDLLTLHQEIDFSEDCEDIIEDDDPFMFLVEHLLGHAHGLRNWKNAKCYRRISDVLTISDEAFVLLSIENCWDAIQEDMEENDDADGETNEKHGAYGQGKYTNQGMNLKYGGWSHEGIKWLMSCMTWWRRIAMNMGKEG